MPDTALNRWLQVGRAGFRVFLLIFAGFSIGLGGGFFVSSHQSADSSAGQTPAPADNPTLPGQISWSLSIQGTATAVPAATARPAGTAVAPAPTAAAGQRYVIQSGDTLGAIATRFGTTVDAIVAANGIASAASIQAGQTITIPSR